MSLDIGNVFKQMADSAGQSLQKEGGDLGDGFINALNNNKASIEELVQARVSGDINEQEFKVELEREKSILEVELLSLEIIGKAAVQKALNSAMSTLTGAVSAAL